MSEYRASALELLLREGERFAGFSLDYRKSGVTWPAPFRARLFANKNEREDYRIEVYGETAEEALEQLVRRVWAVDETYRRIRGEPRRF